MADARTDGGVLPERLSALYSVQDERTNALIRCESDSSGPRAIISGSASGAEVADQVGQVGLLARTPRSSNGSNTVLIPHALETTGIGQIFLFFLFPCAESFFS